MTGRTNHVNNFLFCFHGGIFQFGGAIFLSTDVLLLLCMLLNSSKPRLKSSWLLAFFLMLA